MLRLSIETCKLSSCQPTSPFSILSRPAQQCASARPSNQKTKRGMDVISGSPPQNLQSVHLLLAAHGHPRLVGWLHVVLDAFPCRSYPNPANPARTRRTYSIDPGTHKIFTPNAARKTTRVSHVHMASAQYYGIDIISACSSLGEGGGGMKMKKRAAQVTSPTLSALLGVHPRWTPFSHRNENPPHTIATRIVG